MSSPFSPTLLLPFLVPPVVALAFNVKAALFTAFTTESTVAILPVSPSFTLTVPESVPVVTDSMAPVTTFNPLLSSVVIVVPSVLTFTPSFVTSKDLSAGFIVILLSPFFSKPLPKFTLYFTVDTLLFVVSTVAVVPSPFIKFTVSYGCTKSFSSPLPCKFHPAFNTSPTVAALFLIPTTSSGAAALVVGGVVPALAPFKLLATFVIRLPPLFNPSWFNVTVF